MPKPTHNGVDSTKRHQIDPAAGHAALLLVESLIHHLVSSKILTVQEAIEIIEVATEVEDEVRLAAHDGLAPLTQPSSLAALANSMRLDL